MDGLRHHVIRRQVKVCLGFKRLTILSSSVVRVLLTASILVLSATLGLNEVNYFMDDWDKVLFLIDLFADLQLLEFGSNLPTQFLKKHVDFVARHFAKRTLNDFEVLLLIVIVYDLTCLLILILLHIIGTVLHSRSILISVLTRVRYLGRSSFDTFLNIEVADSLYEVKSDLVHFFSPGLCTRISNQVVSELMKPSLSYVFVSPDRWLLEYINTALQDPILLLPLLAL